MPKTVETKSEVALVPPPPLDIIEAPVSKEMQLLRDEMFILQSIFHILGNGRIEAKEWQTAGKLLDYVNAKIIVLELAIKAQEDKEKAN